MVYSRAGAKVSERAKKPTRPATFFYFVCNYFVCFPFLSCLLLIKFRLFSLGLFALSIRLYGCCLFGFVCSFVCFVVLGVCVYLVCCGLLYTRVYVCCVIVFYLCCLGYWLNNIFFRWKFQYLYYYHQQKQHYQYPLLAFSFSSTAVKYSGSWLSSSICSSVRGWINFIRLAWRHWLSSPSSGFFMPYTISPSTG